MATRRVVAGRVDGKAVVVSDGEVEPTTVALLAGASFDLVWGTDAVPLVPGDGSPPATTGYFPPPGGARMIVLRAEPAGAVPAADADADALAEMDAKLPGMVDVMGPGSGGMHASETVDLSIVIAGQVAFSLDGGEVVALGPGDVVINNGVRHAWANTGTTPCTIVAVMLGAAARSDARA